MRFPLAVALLVALVGAMPATMAPGCEDITSCEPPIPEDQKVCISQNGVTVAKSCSGSIFDLIGFVLATTQEKKAEAERELCDRGIHLNCMMDPPSRPPELGGEPLLP